MKKLLLAAVCTAASTTGASAATVNLDFVAEAAGNEGGVENQTLTFGGLGVTITSSSNAYLDDLSGGKPAGLGFCSTGLTSGNQCVDAGDDNVTSGESVTLTFSQGILGLSNFVFYDGDHNAISSTATLGWGGTDSFPGFPNFSGTSTFADLETEVADFVVPPLLSFTLAYDTGSTTASEFYLGSVDVEYLPAAVPLPASILLMFGAVGGLGALRRRKKAA